ncbi:hypothetical protein BGZ76_004612, partial [Entomortierella beljakovae]
MVESDVEEVDKACNVVYVFHFDRMNDYFGASDGEKNDEVEEEVDDDDNAKDDLDSHHYNVLDSDDEMDDEMDDKQEAWWLRLGVK